MPGAGAAVRALATWLGRRRAERDKSGPATRRRRAAERSGHSAEWLAAAVLMLRGYRILERRHRSRLGEIDIIALRGRRLAFVEVKLRPTLEEAVGSIGDGQCRRIADAAERWVWRHPRYREHEIGLDAVFLAPGRLPMYAPHALQPV
jgi:putative endonuclease